MELEGENDHQLFGGPHVGFGSRLCKNASRTLRSTQRKASAHEMLLDLKCGMLGQVFVDFGNLTFAM